MGDGTKFAIAIAIFFAGMFCFFIAFHPSGAVAAKHPDDVLLWLLGEWDITTSGTSNFTDNLPSLPTPINSTTNTNSPTQPGLQ